MFLCARDARDEAIELGSVEHVLPCESLIVAQHERLPDFLRNEEVRQGLLNPQDVLPPELGHANLHYAELGNDTQDVALKAFAMFSGFRRKSGLIKIKSHDETLKVGAEARRIAKFSRCVRVNGEAQQTLRLLRATEHSSAQRLGDGHSGLCTAHTSTIDSEHHFAQDQLILHAQSPCKLQVSILQGRQIKGQAMNGQWAGNGQAVPAARNKVARQLAGNRQQVGNGQTARRQWTNDG